MNELNTETKTKTGEVKELPHLHCSDFMRSPGKGWTKIGRAPVWKHECGISVHAGGLVKIPDMEIIAEGTQPYWGTLDIPLKLTGYNRRRAVMIWGLWVYSLFQNRDVSDAE